LLSGVCWIRRDAMNPIDVNLEHKPNIKFCRAKVEKVVRLSDNEYENYLQSLTDYHDFILDNAELMRKDKNGVYHCLLVTGENHRDGILIEAEGYGFAWYSSHVPDAAAFLYDSLSEAGYRLAFLVDQFVTRGLDSAQEGYWEVGFEKIREQSGLELGENPFLRELMADMIIERPEVAEVYIREDCFSVRCRPEFCRDHQKEEIPESREMEYEAFAETLDAIRPDSREAAAVWYEWAKELEEFDKGGETERAGKKAEAFLDEFAGRFRAIQERHGDEVAGQMISLAEIPSCLFPWEMKLAAEHLADGGSVHDIPQMSREGVLEDFSDAGQGKAPVQSM